MEGREEAGVTWFLLTTSEAVRFGTAAGALCGPAPPEVRDSLLGWQSGSVEPACLYDTLDEGLLPARLELRWAAELPRAGGYRVSLGRFRLGAWGEVLVRGAALGQYWSRARVELELRSPSCRATWSTELAEAKVAGDWTRLRAFGTWVEPGDLELVGCKAGERLELRLRLVGEANRGRVVVEWFGFNVGADEDANRVFALRPAPTPPSGATGP